MIKNTIANDFIDFYEYFEQYPLICDDIIFGDIDFYTVEEYIDCIYNDAIDLHNLTSDNLKCTSAPENDLYCVILEAADRILESIFYLRRIVSNEKPSCFLYYYKRVQKECDEAMFLLKYVKNAIGEHVILN